MNFHVQSLKEKYLHGWERQATVILLASALLLTLHRYYNRRSIFNRHFAEYFSSFPLIESHSYYYWFLMTALTLVTCPRARCETRNKRAAEGLRISTRKPETRMECDRSCMVSDDTGGYYRGYRVSAFRGKVPTL